MAERRMFSKSIIDSDLFLDMPQSTQNLYFHLSLRADDDGFVGNPKKIMRMINCSQDDIKILISKQFLIPFESGVVVIKHWKIHNYIRNDRYKPTIYTEEKKKLIEQENKEYIVGIPNGNQMDTQYSIGEDSLDKNSVDKDKNDEKEKEETFKSILDEYTKNKELLESLNGFVEMRKKIKGFTIRALKLSLNKLDSLSNNDQEKIKIVDKTVMNGWKTFYELKDEEKPKESKLIQRNFEEEFGEIVDDIDF